MSSVDIKMKELFGETGPNGRVYNKSVWEEALTKFLNNEWSMGELTHPCKNELKNYD